MCVSVPSARVTVKCGKAAPSSSVLISRTQPKSDSLHTQPRGSRACVLSSTAGGIGGTWHGWLGRLGPLAGAVSGRFGAVEQHCVLSSTAGGIGGTWHGWLVQLRRCGVAG